MRLASQALRTCTTILPPNLEAKGPGHECRVGRSSTRWRAVVYYIICSLGLDAKRLTCQDKEDILRNSNIKRSAFGKAKEGGVPNVSLRASLSFAQIAFSQGSQRARGPPAHARLRSAAPVQHGKCCLKWTWVCCPPGCNTLVLPSISFFLGQAPPMVGNWRPRASLRWGGVLEERVTACHGVSGGGQLPAHVR